MKKFFKFLGILLLVVVLVYLIMCIFGPKDNYLERSIAVNAPQEQVMQKLGDHQYFVSNWSPWTPLDPQAKYTYEGNPGTVGHKFTWDGNDSVGAGHMTIDTITNDRIAHALHFDRPFESDARTWFRTEPAANNQTTVYWGMYSKNPFIMRGMMLFMNMEEMLSGDYVKGLNMLKESIDKDGSSQMGAGTVDFEINEIDWSERTYVGKKETVKFNDIPKFFEDNLPKVFADLEKNKIKMTNPPAGIFWKWDPQNMETVMGAAVGVDNSIKDVKGWEVFKISGTKALVMDYYGAYDKTEGAHNKFDQYMKEKNMTQSAVLEEYITDPKVEKDTTKWLTKIYYILN